MGIPILQSTEMSDSPPSISVQLAIDPPQFIPGCQPTPTLSVTATSHATGPITIFTWGDIFNLPLAQKRKNFTCLDLTTNVPIRMEITKGPKRCGFLRVLGGRDDRFFHTLEPGIPVTFTETFKLWSRAASSPSAYPAHRYRLGLNDEEAIDYWWYGRKEEVLAPPGTIEGLGEPSGPPIQLAPVAPVDFEIKESSTG